MDLALRHTFYAPLGTFGGPVLAGLVPCDPDFGGGRERAEVGDYVLDCHAAPTLLARAASYFLSHADSVLDGFLRIVLIKAISAHPMYSWRIVDSRIRSLISFAGPIRYVIMPKSVSFTLHRRSGLL